MGIPAHTYFCENGHMVADFGHNEMGGDEDNLTCSQCGSKNIRMVLEWQTGEYGDQSHAVPFEPISYKTKRITVKIPSYDVSKLFKERGSRGLPK